MQRAGLRAGDKVIDVGIGTGLVLDHVNAHKHFHLHPTITGLLVKFKLEVGLTDEQLKNTPPVPHPVVRTHDETGAKACLAVVDSNIADQVTWVHSYVSMDKKKSFCVYDAPSPEAIRRTAGRSKLPVGHITEVRVLDPYFYK